MSRTSFRPTVTDLDVWFIGETDLAVKVRVEGSPEFHWFPKAAVQYDAEIGERGWITVPVNLARQKGLY